MLPIVILAGGLATRLRPVTEKIPKSMILIDDKPFIYHQLKLLEKRGFKHVHLCLGYLGQVVEEYVTSKFNDSFKLSFSYDGTPLLGTGGAIVNAFHLLPEIFFITYGDSYLDLDYDSVYNKFLQRENENMGLMTVFKNNDKWDKSNVLFNNNTIHLYSKINKNEYMNYIDFGLGILTKNNFKYKIISEIFDLSEIYETLSIDRKLMGYEVFNRFFEVGSLSGIEDFSNYIKKQNYE